MCKVDQGSFLRVPEESVPDKSRSVECCVLYFIETGVLHRDDPPVKN